jgi:hypothetical protein
MCSGESSHKYFSDESPSGVLDSLEANPIGAMRLTGLSQVDASFVIFFHIAYDHI